MSTRKHTGHPHLTGEYRWGDAGQLVMLVLFLGVWVTDSFIFRYSTFLRDTVPDYVRITAAGVVLFCGWYLARGGMRAVFGTEREKPEIISSGVFRIVRHPIYAGALLFYLGAILITMSIASAVFWLAILAFYIFIARYEERILFKEFGEDYRAYKRKTGMLFPKFRQTKH
ncbi:MAG: isoprenylcysteine carboxylmethyltransferase family protein [Bacteroidota bacterium]